MPARKPYIPICRMPKCHNKAKMVWLCKPHFSRLRYLQRKVSEENYSVEYRKIYKSLFNTADEKAKKRIKSRLRSLPEVQKTKREIKNIEFYMDTSFANRDSKINPKKGLRQRKRKFYIPKEKKLPKICTECGERFAKAKGLCPKCYARKRKEKDNLDICHVEGCSEPAATYWLCKHHYYRWYRTKWMIKTRRFNPELSRMVLQLKDKNIPLPQRNYIDKLIDEKIKRWGNKRDEILKIKREFKKLDEIADIAWRHRYNKKHEKPPKWSGYTKYGPHTSRIRIKNWKKKNT